MIIKLFNTKDSNNTLGKTLTNETSFDCKLKGQTEIISPVIVLKTETPINFNYAQIEEWGRFYFIKNVKYNPNGFAELTLNCDVLESWKADILNSTGEITRQTDFNAYYNSNYQSEVKKEIDKYTSPVTLDLNIKNRVLVTVGGV